MPGSVPRLAYKGSESSAEENGFIKILVQGIPKLHSKYIPPPIWGGNGHVHSLVAQIINKRPGMKQYSVPNRRQSVRLDDDTTFSYDLFDPVKANDQDCDITLLVCPGISNTSENLYVRMYAYQAAHLGYRVAALNLLGVLENEVLTTPKIFTLGSTEEYHGMVQSVKSKYPSTYLIAVGFSLGGNIVCKYLGESPSHQERFIACLSLCQPYDFLKMLKSVGSFTRIRKFQMKFITDGVKAIIMKNYNELIQKDKNGNDVNNFSLKDLKKCQLLHELDEFFTIKRTGHKTIEDYYHWSSSANYIHNIDVPTLLVNAADDPLFPKSLLACPYEKARQHDKTLFVLSEHGGHLGYFTKTGRKHIDGKTWLELMALEYVNSIVRLHKDKAYGKILICPSHGLPEEEQTSESKSMAHLPRKSENVNLYSSHLPQNWSAPDLEDPDANSAGELDTDANPLTKSKTYACFETTV